MLQEYKTICEKCGVEFSSYRKRHLCPSDKKARYCPDCRLAAMHSGLNPRSRKEARYTDSAGYVNVRIGKVFVPEHRYVMEQKLGRKLVKGEIVHHIDGVRSNNAPENLELWVNTHVCGVRASTLICPHCGRAYAEAA